MWMYEHGVVRLQPNRHEPGDVQCEHDATKRERPLHLHARLLEQRPVERRARLVAEAFAVLDDGAG